MWIPLLPLLALAAPSSSIVEAVATIPVAQARLVELLVTADSIDTIHATATATHIAIARGGEAFDVVATTSDTGAIIALSVTDVGLVQSEPGALTWLGGELGDTTAITTVITSAGTITLVTSDGRYYRMLAGRDANAAVESRWAAAWDRDD